MCVNTDGLTLEARRSMFDETWPFDQLGRGGRMGRTSPSCCAGTREGSAGWQPDIEIAVHDSATAAALTEALADAAWVTRGSAKAMERSQPDAAPAIAEGEPPRSRQSPSRSAARAIASCEASHSSAIPPKNRDGGTRHEAGAVQSAGRRVRAGPEADTDKVGEFKAGTVIDVTETVNAGG